MMEPASSSICRLQSQHRSDRADSLMLPCVFKMTIFAECSVALSEENKESGSVSDVSRCGDIFAAVSDIV